MYITLVSMRHFFGVKPFKKDGILKLIKEKDNNYDDEAIKVEMRHAGQVAYVSNSTNTVIRGTMSAGRIYDKILDEDYAQIKFYLFVYNYTINQAFIRNIVFFAYLKIIIFKL